MVQTRSQINKQNITTTVVEEEEKNINKSEEKKNISFVINFPDLEEEDEDDYEDYDDEKYMEEIKKTDPEAHTNLVKIKEEQTRREPSIIRILKSSIDIKRKTDLFEMFEVYRMMDAPTEEAILMKTRINTLLDRYEIEEIERRKLLDDEKIKSINASSDKIEALHPKLSYREQILLLEADDEVKSVLINNLKEIELSELSMSEETSKQKRWLNTALSLPYNKLYRDVENRPTQNIISHVKKELDKTLYGMDKVKEQLLLFLNSKIRHEGMKGCSIGLIGPPGVGKCLDPNTEVLTWDRGAIKAKYIKQGDLLVGDDLTSRQVLSTCEGIDEMFEIRTSYDYSFIVNRPHILTCKHKGTIVDISVHDLLKLSETKRSEYLAFRCVAEFEEKDTYIDPYEAGKMFCYTDKINIEDYMYNSKRKRMQFMFGLIENYPKSMGSTLKITLPKNKRKNLVWLIRSIGIQIDITDYGVEIYDESNITQVNNTLCGTFKIISKGTGKYVGFKIDGNRRFLLGDTTVTHNTMIARTLASALSFPFEQISFGGVTGSEFLLGHDYTYIGSKPGEIAKSLIRMKHKNGILFLDEFEKVSTKKDIISTLLHITDFSQNNEFRDNYLSDIKIDLSSLWFIYSMNNLPEDPALRDRLFLIEVPGYTASEKIKILIDYLLPRALTNIGLCKSSVTCDKETAKIIIHNSVKTEGIRELERSVKDIINKIHFMVSNKDSSWTSFYCEQIKNYPVNLTSEILKCVMIKKEESNVSPYVNMYC
jgi:ATP-dependent Lon protease